MTSNRTYTRRAFLDALAQRVLVYDGAMGTSLQNLNLSAEHYGGEKYNGCPDYLNITYPEAPISVHRSFLEVGVDVIETNTFRSNRLTLGEYGLGERTIEINKVGAQLARKLADEFSTPEQPRFVAGSMGPSGKLLAMGEEAEQSLVHAFVEFVDGSVLAQVGFPTMELPILYALTHPERVADAGTRRFDPVAAGSLTFEPVRPEIYPAYRLGRAAGATGGTAATAFNAANEVAVGLFLEGKMRFGRIAETIARVLDAHRPTDASTLEAVLAADAAARRLAREVACSS